MKATCTRPACENEALSPEITSVLGDEAVGLCADCAAEQLASSSVSSSPSTSDSEPQEHSLVELAAAQREVEAFNIGGKSDEEILAGELSRSEVTDDELSTLQRLYDLDRRISDRATILDDRDREILEEAFYIGRVKCSEIAESLGIHRTTVWRRIKRLLHAAPALHRFAATLLGKANSQPFKAVIRLTKSVAWHASEQEGSPPEDVMTLEETRLLNAMYRAGRDGRRIVRPPIGPRFRRQGDKVVITGSGPLPPLWRKAIREGSAVRVFDPPRCHTCGKFLPRATTGRPRKYCDERCRSRYRRKMN